MLDAVLERLPAERLAGHFHDTNGRALDNIAVSVGKGLRIFDAAAGGLGGCPFAPGAEGNVATGRTVDHLHARSEEHTSELQSLMRISYAVFCLKKKNT